MLQRTVDTTMPVRRRLLRYGLFGTVLTGLGAGALLWASVDKTVTLEVDGAPAKVHTTARTVGAALNSAGYRVGAHDLVAPGPDSALADGETVVLRRGRLLHLTVDGQLRDVWTTASTVDEALDDLGYTGLEATSVSRSSRLPLTATGIAIRSPKAVTVAHDGRTDSVTTTAATVADMLNALGVKLATTDTVSVALASAPVAGEQVVVHRVAYRSETVSQPVPFPTQQQNDPGLVSGETTLVQPGVNGSDAVVYSDVFIDGKLVGHTEVNRTHTVPATPQVVHIGTGAPPPDDVANNQAIARSMLGQYGFSDDQMGCLIQMWNHESGWKATAENPNGGAYGIPQSLPGSKMASAGANWQTDPRVQIAWGLQYIKNSYGTPCNAWATWQAHGGWY